MGTAATLMLIWKIFFSSISGGILYSDVKNSIHQHKTMFTLISIGSFIIFIYTIGEVIWHVKGGDSRYPLLNYMFEVYIQKDAEAVFWAEHQKSLEGCQSYVDRHPKGRFLDQANECIERGITENDIRNFENAKSINTIAAYRQYIRGANNSKYIPIAESKIHILENEEKQEEFEWTETRKTLEGCQSYAEQHQKGTFLEQAINCVKERKKEIDNENFRKAERENIISAYQDYIGQCSKNTCENKVKAAQNISLLIEQEETASWNRIESSLTLEQCQSHLTKYPNGKYFEKANKCVHQYKLENDNENFRKAENENTISAYQNYISKCSENTCESKAKAEQTIHQIVEQQEIVDWGNISTSLKLEECRAHLKKYPNGKYYKQAETCIKQRKDEYCVKNEEDAKAAAEKAAGSYGIGAGAATGTGCAALLILTGWFDFGASAALCTAAATAATAIGAGKSSIAKDNAYKEIRDPQCL